MSLQIDPFYLITSEQARKTGPHQFVVSKTIYAQPYKYMAIDRLVIPYVFYNVLEDTQVEVNNDTGSGVGVIKKGQYNIPTLIDELNKIDPDGNKPFVLNGNTYQVTKKSTPHFTKIPYNISKLLGFQNEITATGSEVTGSDNASAFPFYHILIRIPDLAEAAYNDGIVGAFPVTSSLGSIIAHSPTHMVKVPIDRVNVLQKMTIEFYDSDYTPIVLGNTRWEMIVRLTKE